MSLPAQPPMVATEQPELTLWRGNSKWVAASWSDLPGFETDVLFEAWNAFLKSCERPGLVFAPLCSEIRVGRLP